MKISYLFLFLSLLAEVVGTVGGFGSSVFFVPIANFYFDFYSVLGLTVLFHLSSNLSKLFLFHRGIDPMLIIYIGIPSVVFAIIGSVTSKFIDDIILEICLGVTLVLISSVFILVKNLVIKPNKRNSFLGGLVSGFSAGLLGTGGAIRGLTLASFNLEKTIFVSTSAVIDLAIDISRSSVYYSNGYIHGHDLIYVPFLIVIGLAGTYIGKRILRHISQDRFRQISLMLVLFIGLITLLKQVL